MKFENEGIIVDQEDLLDAYVAVAMALVHALNARELRRGGVLSQQLDRLRLYNWSDRDAIITALIKDCFFALPAEPLRGGAESQAVAEGSRGLRLTRSNFSSSPTAKEVLIDVVGKWLGKQLDHWTSRDERYPTEFLEDVALRCTELRPQEPENHYRLAAIRLLLGKTDAARKAIDAARAHDSRARQATTTTLSVRAEMAVNDLDRLSEEAKCAIYVARAVARGGDETRSKLAEAFKKTLIYQAWDLDIDKSPLSPPYTILFESLGLSYPAAEKPEATTQPPTATS
jgi:hypothetical protein